MSKTFRILSFLVVICALAGAGIGYAQDKPAAGQDKKETASAADPLTGNWEGSVETPNGVVTFTLKVMLEKDKFAGEIASPEGSLPITGTWIDGKFTGNFDYNGSPMVMTGTLKEAVLGGEINMGGGQAVMNWTARKVAETK